MIAGRLIRSLCVAEEEDEDIPQMSLMDRLKAQMAEVSAPKPTAAAQVDLLLLLV
jgi:hypothetical protein